jgi:pimeloyl-ACP methyl ester carboxylesterase
MKHGHIEANGITLHVVELGDGPVVLFVHGFPDTWRGWRRQMEVVAAAGYRAISLDMRGYGESSAPSDPALYTPFHTVGDLVGLLDALDLKAVTVVGHDFGATVAWNAALMRPDRFSAVFCLSVPYLPPGKQSFLQQLRDSGMEETFYMFWQMRSAADRDWADAETTIPGAFYWTSGSAPADKRWDPFDPSLGLTRPSPVGIPGFADRGDMKAAIAEFERTGFRGPLNYYRAIDSFFAMSSAFVGASIRQPSFFMIGSADGLNKLLRVTEETLRSTLPGLSGFVVLEGIGHWPQLEATNAVNEALLGFLADIKKPLGET